VSLERAAVKTLLLRRHRIVHVQLHSGLCPSKGQARKDIEGGGIYVNNVRAGEITRALNLSDILFERYVLLRKGKRTYAVLTLE
jgi:tyrosyl-tRNA synthetase